MGSLVLSTSYHTRYMVGPDILVTLPEDSQNSEKLEASPCGESPEFVSLTQADIFGGGAQVVIFGGAWASARP